MSSLCAPGRTTWRMEEEGGRDEGEWEEVWKVKRRRGLDEKGKSAEDEEDGEGELDEEGQGEQGSEVMVVEGVSPECWVCRMVQGGCASPPGPPPTVYGVSQRSVGSENRWSRDATGWSGWEGCN